MRIAIITTIAIGIAIVIPANVNPFTMKNIKTFLINQVKSHQTPSIQYAFFDTDSILFELRYGLKNIKTREAIEASTTYHLYSVTKTFTALAVLQLAQQGKLALNQPVAVYLTDFPYEKNITIEQLLNHTSGIPNPIPLKWIHLESEHQRFSHDKFFRQIFVEHATPDFEAGTRFKYSNLGYVLLGQLIEKVSGISYEEYVRQNIVEKSGLKENELSFTIDPVSHATGYHKWFSLTNAALEFLIDKSKFMGDREGRWKPFKLFYNNGKAYGGLVGSSKGLIKYAQALISNESILLDQRHKEILFTEKIINNNPTGMSYSWFTGELKGNRYFAHAGGGGGYYVEIRIYPELHAGSVILYNRSGMTDARILDKADSFFLTRKN